MKDKKRIVELEGKIKKSERSGRGIVLIKGEEEVIDGNDSVV